MFVKPHKITRLFYPTVTWKQEVTEKHIWLTFDDGPCPKSTPWILSILKETNIKATFFLIGQEMIKYPELVSMINSEEHILANHSYSHLNGWLCSNKLYLKDIEKCQKLMPKNILFRPPYGKIWPWQIKKISENYKIILWDILSEDFRKKISPIQIKSNVINNIEAGSIIVFHNNSTSYKKLKPILKDIIINIKEKGYSFSTSW